MKSGIVYPFRLSLLSTSLVLVLPDEIYFSSHCSEVSKVSVFASPNGRVPSVFSQVLGSLHVLFNDPAVTLTTQAQLNQSLLEMKDAKGRMDAADEALRKA